MKLFKQPLAYLLPLLFAGFVVSCGPSEADEQAMEDAFSELESALDELDEMDMSDEMSTGGETFESADGHFKIFFQGAPTISDETVPTEVGNIEMKTFMYEKSITEAFMVAYSDYPSALIELSDPQTLLQGGKDGALGSLGISTLDEEREIELDGNPGLYFKGNNSSYYVVYEVYLVDNRLYQVAILRDGSYPSQEDVDSFIGTFELAGGNDEATADEAGE